MIERAPDVSGSPGTFVQLGAAGVKCDHVPGHLSDSQYHVLVPGASLEWGWLFCLFRQCQCHDIATATAACTAHESDCHGSLSQPDQTSVGLTTPIMRMHFILSGRRM